MFNLRQRFSGKSVLIVGDVMVDEYYIGNVDRISPEAPVPVVNVTKRDRRPGGAANVALNVMSLGGRASICSVRGNDSNGEWLDNHLKSIGVDTSGMVVDVNRPTTIKTRIIGNNHQMLRVDQEDCSYVADEVEVKIKKHLGQNIQHVDAVILQDYNKGLLSKSVIRYAIKTARKHDIPTLVDPKREHFLDYKDVTWFKPNRKEIIEGLKLDTSLSTRETIESALSSLRDKLNAKYTLLTLSEQGVALNDREGTHYIPAHPRRIADVSGAGDSVISVAALCVASDFEPKEVAAISNLAGGLVCEKVGVVAIELEQLEEATKEL
jgi:rfaE bifunctional protein kinase chain/domain